MRKLQMNRVVQPSNQSLGQWRMFVQQLLRLSVLGIAITTSSQYLHHCARMSAAVQCQQPIRIPLCTNPAPSSRPLYTINCLRSRVLASEGRREAQPSPNGFMVLGTEVSTTQQALSGCTACWVPISHEHAHGVGDRRSLSPQQPPGKEPRNRRSSALSPVVRAEQVLALHKPMTGPPAGPRRTAGDQVSLLGQYNHLSTCHPLSYKTALHVPRAQAPVTVP